jgi:hypothetical protein
MSHNPVVGSTLLAEKPKPYSLTRKQYHWWDPEEAQETQESREIAGSNLHPYFEYPGWTSSIKREKFLQH